VKKGVGLSFAFFTSSTFAQGVIYEKHLLQGLIVGGVFAALITWIGASDALAEGFGWALVASVVFGLAAGLCIGGLIAANFAMLDLEEKEHQEAVAHQRAHAHA
jgi:hypothetical protein